MQGPIDTIDIGDIEVVIDHGEIQHILAQGNMAGPARKNEQCRQSNCRPIGRIESIHSREGELAGSPLLSRDKDNETGNHEKHD